MDQKIYDLIDSYKEDFAAMLQRWIRVPSVESEAEDGAPFGPEVKRMLDMAMVDAETMGFLTHVYNGYACDITLGDENKEMFAILGHLDVVPAGDGWEVDPFAAVRDGDKIIGRGVMDDKGPSLCALYAMKALMEAKVPLKRSIRLILGCDEESGWEDMHYYCEHAQMPEIGFSPDASFPLINTEKAMLGFALTGKTCEEGLQVKEMMTGERKNVIPGESRAIVAGGQEIVNAVAAYAAKTGLPYSAKLTDGGVELFAEGIPGHSAYPEGRRNAIGMMLLLMRELGVQGDLLTLANAVGMEYNGASLGCACEDDVSGALTNNIGILHVENGKITATLDFRVPVKADLDTLEKACRDHLPGWAFGPVSRTEPHHVPADSELVSSLLAAYTEESGLPGYPESTGGGTYAKVLKQGVAFGAGFPEDPDLAHQAGEWASLDKLMLATKIYANALVRLCAE